MKGLPTRWAHKHGAFYYRPREHERAAFDGKTWYRLGVAYHEALRAFADRMEIQCSDKLGGPLIEAHCIELHTHTGEQHEPRERWYAVCPTDGGSRGCIGPTPLVAAMRALCFARLGEHVELPGVLCDA